jgi:hypothetical protein
MKKYCYFFGLLVIHPLISARYSSFTTSVKKSNTYSPPLKQAKHTQAVTPEFQTAPDKTYKGNITVLLGFFRLFWPLARFYNIGMSLRILGWQLESLALLQSTKDKARRLWNNHRPDRKIIHLEA